MMKKLRGGGGVVYHGRTRSDLFESLPDDIVISVLCKLRPTTSSPSDFVAILLTCKRLDKLGVDPLVLSKSCSKALVVRATNWCDDAHRFLKLYVNADNIEAYCILGVCNTLGKSHITVNKRDVAFMSKTLALQDTTRFGDTCTISSWNSAVKHAWVEAVPGWVTSWKVLARWSKTKP